MCNNTLGILIIFFFGGGDLILWGILSIFGRFFEDDS